MKKKLYIITYDDHRHISGVAGRSRMLINWFKDEFEEIVEIPLARIDNEITYSKIEDVKIIEPLTIIQYFKNKIKSKNRSGNKLNSTKESLVKRTLRRMNMLFDQSRINRIVGKNQEIIVLGFQRISSLRIKTLKNNDVILSQSNLSQKSFENFLKKDYEKMKYLKKIVVYTEKDLKEIQKRLYEMNIILENERFEIIPNPSKILRVKKSKFSKNLIFLSRLYDEQKNLKDLKKIMMELQDFELKVYGEGPDKKMLENISNIKLMGKTCNVTDAYSGNAIFLMTSHYEGFGNTNVEAMSCGLPVVAFDTFPAISSIIDNGKNGYLIEPQNISDFVEKIKKIVSEPEIYKKFSDSAFEKSKIYEEDVIQSKWTAILKP